MLFEKLGSRIIYVQKREGQIHFPNAIFSIQAGIKMLTFLHELITALFEGQVDMKELICDPSNHFSQLQIEFTALASAYIMHVCTIEGIIKKSYKDMKLELKNCDYKETIPNDSKEIGKRAKELESYKWYRDKVFAHTSFDWSKTDSKSIQHSTLKYYAGNFFVCKGKHLAFGGGAMIIDEKFMPPTLDIIEEHKKILQHFSTWEIMFTNILDKIDDRSKLKEKLENLH